MAISKNMLLNGITGSISKQIVLRNYRGKIVVSAYPNMDGVKFTDKQLKRQKLMAQATAESKLVMNDEQLRNAALIRLNVPRNRLFNALIKDFFAKQREKELSLSRQQA